MKPFCRAFSFSGFFRGIYLALLALLIHGCGGDAGAPPQAGAPVIEKATPPTAEGVANAQPVFRFAKISNGAYFYTGSVGEKDLILQSYPDFRCEGVAFYRTADDSGSPVYRFANLFNGGYFYTASTAERDFVMQTRPDLRYEGTTFSVSGPMPGAQPVYRLANLKNGAYLYTANKAEQQFAVGLGIWRDEGEAFVGAPVPSNLVTPEGGWCVPTPAIDRSPFVVSGVISGPVVKGVTVLLANGRSTTTDAAGVYRFAGVANGSYTVTPYLAGHSFTPSTTLISVNNADIPATNFAGAATGSDANIGQALACGPTLPGGAGNVPEFQQQILNTAVFPDALCNDGTPAVLYFRPYRGEANRDKWVLNLHGGGSCSSGDTCAARWCSCANTSVCPFAKETTFFDRYTMTNSSPQMKGAAGIFLRDSALNPHADYNHVEFSYCTSDTWQGTRRSVQLSTTHPKTGQSDVKYTVHFLGAKVLDADIATLRQAGVPALTYTLGGASIKMPDLDDATEVIISGDSGGGNGLITHLDNLSATLRANNTRCQGAACPLRVTGLMDAIVAPDRSKLGYATFAQPSVRSYADYLTFLTALPSDVNARRDVSCLAFHAADTRPCRDESHVVRHHVTTPFFVRSALADRLITSGYIEAGLQNAGTPATPMTVRSFGLTLQAELSAFGNLSATAEEGAAFTRQPGVFAPGCTDHDTIHTTVQTYNTTITPPGGTPQRMLQIFSNWQNGLAPSVLVTQSPLLADTVCP